MKWFSAAARRMCALPLLFSLLAVLAMGCGSSTDDRESRSDATELPRPPAAKASPHAEGPYSLPPISQVQAAQLAAFALLHKPADGVPLAVQGYFRKPVFGSNWKLARRIPAKAEGNYWLVPGDGHLCVISQGVMGNLSVGATCVKTAEATAHGIATVSISPPGAPDRARLIVGVAPDGPHEALVQTRGDVAVVPIQRETFVLRDATLAPPDSISLR
jgi:hypothetical protein